MFYISHRGNLDGLNPERENSPEYIDEALSKGYDVEIDVWFVDGKFSLGHDFPQYATSRDWLYKRRKNIWIHCKNFNALSELVRQPSLRVFFHEKEQYTIISNGLIWAHNIDLTDKYCIIPLLSLESIWSYNKKEIGGVCSDFIYECERKFND